MNGATDCIQFSIHYTKPSLILLLIPYPTSEQFKSSSFVARLIKRKSHPLLDKHKTIIQLIKSKTNKTLPCLSEECLIVWLGNCASLSLGQYFKSGEARRRQTKNCVYSKFIGEIRIKRIKEHIYVGVANHHLRILYLFVCGSGKRTFLLSSRQFVCGMKWTLVRK